MKPLTDYEIQHEKAYLKYRDECRAYFINNPTPKLTREEQLNESAKTIQVVGDAMGDFYGNHRMNFAMTLHGFTKEELLNAMDTI